MAMKEAEPEQPVIQEDRLNDFGYQLLDDGNIQAAIDVFRINTILYPDAFNTFDSLGEAYILAGKQELGIQNYEKSLELNPGNQNAVDILKKLRAKKDR